MARLFPELINDVNDTLNKLILVQKAVKETEQTSQIEDAFVRYLDGPLMNFVKYDVNSGIYA
ncbi:hypothetical protein [Vulcanisaeta sp. JCM 16159]|uniref:hypothetical protein n=1 Tax=Vulcanisaeta sp. JCM 16159 TaxID=1295371 RepID=UPI0006D1A4D1|nr:hypothetical protein [Vulcanisaeta sp. JCM 16159]